MIKKIKSCKSYMSVTLLAKFSMAFFFCNLNLSIFHMSLICCLLQSLPISLCSLLFMIAHKLCKQANTTSSFCRHFALLSTTWNSSCCNDLWMLLVFMTPSTAERALGDAAPSQHSTSWFSGGDGEGNFLCGCLFFPKQTPPAAAASEQCQALLPLRVRVHPSMVASFVG